MNDVNIMPGIDLKANKLKIRKQLRRKRRLNKLLNIGIVIVLIVFVSLVVYLNKKMTKNALNSCKMKGNSYEYCINHI